MVTLTTVARVRQRLQLEDWEGATAAITQFIEDAEAVIINALGSLPAAADTNFGHAGTIATDIAAFYTGISLPPLKDEEAQKARQKYIREFKATADAELLKLRTPPATVPLPRSTTS